MPMEQLDAGCSRGVFAGKLLAPTMVQVLELLVRLSKKKIAAARRELVPFTTGIRA